MSFAKYFLGCLILVSFVYGLSPLKQNTLYEWNPGDQLKANSLGKYIAVGYIHDFVYVERRGVVAFSNESLQNKDVKLTFFLQAYTQDVNLTVCPMLEDWGQGKSNTTDYLHGTDAELNDATWKYPFYNGTESKLWHDRIFGGYFNQILGVSVTVVSDSFSVVLPYSEYGYLIKFSDKTVNTILIYGIYSEHPPIAEVVYTEYEELLFYYLIPGGVAFLLILIVIIILFIRYQRRRDYIPLLDIEAGDIHLSQLKGIEDALIAAKIKRVDESSIVYGKKIGSGTSGEVFSGKLGSKFVAIKKIKTMNLTQHLKVEDIVKSISSELIILSKLDHINILGLIAIVIGEDYADFGIITELMELGNLTRTLHNNIETVSPERKRKIIVGIAKGMSYLHSQKPSIIHRDLKPENILLDPDYNPKITDFGISRSMEETLQSMTISGTPAYMAPESLYGGPGAFSKKSDVYSFGIIMIEIINQQRPNTGMSNENIMLERAQGNYKYELPNDCSEDFRKIIRECLRKLQTSRPSFTDILIELKEY